MELEAVVDELYGLSPAEFTAARDSKAAEARKSGDRDLAAAIRQLRRPSASAWLANSLSRQRPHRVDELLSLGDRLREAQRRLAGQELKELSREGRRVVGDLVDEGERLAASAGARVSASTLRQLQETLEAALADAAAGGQLRSGQLAAALSYAGLGSEIGDNPAPVAEDPATIAAGNASADLHAAEMRLAELTAELQSAHLRRDRVREQVGELEHQLKQVRAQESEVDHRVSELEAAIKATYDEAAHARAYLPR